MNTNAIIETKNATIDTMVVTIRALHVSGKQMTLSVFRQLPLGKAFDEEGNLQDYEFWGIVRYQITSTGPAVWLVGSRNGILYRISATPPLNVRSCEAHVQNISATLHCKNSVYTAQKRSELLAELAKSKSGLDKAYMMYASIQELLELPQLFIAV